MIRDSFPVGLKIDETDGLLCSCMETGLGEGLAIKYIFGGREWEIEGEEGRACSTISIHRINKHDNKYTLEQFGYFPLPTIWEFFEFIQAKALEVANPRFKVSDEYERFHGSSYTVVDSNGQLVVRFYKSGKLIYFDVLLSNFPELQYKMIDLVEIVALKLDNTFPALSETVTSNDFIIEDAIPKHEQITLQKFQINQIDGILYEYGAVFIKGRSEESNKDWRIALSAETTRELFELMEDKGYKVRTVVSKQLKKKVIYKHLNNIQDDDFCLEFEKLFDAPVIINNLVLEVLIESCWEDDKLNYATATKIIAVN